MEPKTYQTLEVYKEVADTLYAVSGIVLFSFAKHDCDTKNTIIRNFIARSSMSLKSIFALWDINDFQNTWILYRSLVDRMFHLRHVGTKNEFIEFDDWSFFEQYKSQNRLKSDKEFKHEAVGWVYELSTEQKDRMRKLEKQKPIWKRPKAEDVAKDMEMEFLYKYGYDFASKHVHPMSDDGHQDFYTITKLEPSPRFPSHITVIHSSMMTALLILQDGLSFSSFKWRPVLLTYLDEVKNFLINGDKSYQLSFLKLANLFNSETLCERIIP